MAASLTTSFETTPRRTKLLDLQDRLGTVDENQRRNSLLGNKQKNATDLPLTMQIPDTDFIKNYVIPRGEI